MKNANREGVIKYIINNNTSDISLLDEDSINDENISNQIKNLINSKKISFENYFNKIKKTNSVIKGINELRRNLETLYINTYGMPIYFTYPIFRTHLLWTKIALIAEVAFNSLEGNFYMEMYFGEQIKIFAESKHTSFNQIADHISTIISRANILLSSQNKEGLI